MDPAIPAAGREYASPTEASGPDLSFLSLARVESGYPARKFRRIAPDLAVEIVSPSNRTRDLIDKAHQFLDARYVWVVDPIRKAITRVPLTHERHRRGNR